MKIYDTHTHFSANEEEVKAVLERAEKAGVTRLMAVGCSDELNKSAQLAYDVRPDMVRMAICADRDECGDDARNEELMKAIRELVEQVNVAKNGRPSPLAAYGEIGLDYYYGKENRKEQCDLFARELAYADELKLPVVIHTREADDDTIGVLKEVPFHGSSLRGIIHCYTGGVDFARKLLDMGFMISISGIVTFRAAENVRNAARFIPDDRLLIETDAPYLAPVPMRGKANEPSYIVHTAKFMAQLRNTDEVKFAEITYNNAVELLG